MSILARLFNPRRLTLRRRQAIHISQIPVICRDANRKGKA